MRETNAERLKRWISSGEAALHPATFPQRELWETSPVPPNSPTNNICTVTRIRGAVAQGLCEEALSMVVARQEVLRLSILPGKRGALQLVRKHREPNIHFELGEDLGPERTDAAIDAAIALPFDLVSGPLYRVHVLRQSAGEHVLVLVIHHAIADGWSLGAFMTDLWTSYAMLVLAVPNASLDSVPLSYTDWGAAERAFWTPDEIEIRKTYWQNYIGGAPRVFDAPDTTPEKFLDRGRLVAEVPGGILGGLREIAAGASATLFATVLSAFQILLAHSTGKTDILVGSPIAARNKKNVFDTMGSFAGIVPHRTRVDPASSVRELIVANHDSATESFARSLPFVELVKALGESVTPGKNPVFDVRFALQNHPMPEINTPGMEVEYRVRSTGTCRFDIACELTEIGTTMEVVWIYRRDTFEPEAVQKLHDDFMILLDKLTLIQENPDKTIKSMIQCLA